MDYATPVTTSANTAVSASTFLIISMFWLAIVIFFVVCMWRIFTKAGKPGWASIVPVYNYIVMLEIVGRPIWWIILFFIPLVNIVISIIVFLDFAASYGKSTLFGVLGLIFFPYIGIPMLAFGSAKYVGPAALGGLVSATPPTSTAPPVAPSAPSAPTAPTPPPAV